MNVNQEHNPSKKLQSEYVCQWWRDETIQKNVESRRQSIFSQTMKSNGRFVVASFFILWCVVGRCEMRDWFQRERKQVMSLTWVTSKAESYYISWKSKVSAFAPSLRRWRIFWIISFPYLIHQLVVLRKEQSLPWWKVLHPFFLYSYGQEVLLQVSPPPFVLLWSPQEGEPKSTTSKIWHQFRRTIIVWRGAAQNWICLVQKRKNPKMIMTVVVAVEPKYLPPWSKWPWWKWPKKLRPRTSHR